MKMANMFYQATHGEKKYQSDKGIFYKEGSAFFGDLDGKIIN